ncbi:MAG: AbrB/MazE/SpoVT family DNA-binding domain-containing protein [Anaerolineae bacterium]
MYEKEVIRVVTQKGQVTIPIELRRALGIKPKDRVIFSIQEDHIILKPASENLTSAYGAVPPLNRPEDFQALRDQALEEHATHTVKEMDPDDEVS